MGEIVNHGLSAPAILLALQTVPAIRKKARDRIRQDSPLLCQVCLADGGLHALPRVAFYSLIWPIPFAYLSWKYTRKLGGIVEEKTGKGFGDPSNPLLVSVRSGAKFSMPGMMDTVLNVGLNDESVEGLIAQTSSDRFAWDSYRRLVQMFGKTVMGVDGDLFELGLEPTSIRMPGPCVPFACRSPHDLTADWIDLAAVHRRHCRHPLAFEEIRGDLPRSTPREARITHACRTRAVRHRIRAVDAREGYRSSVNSNPPSISRAVRFPLTPHLLLVVLSPLAAWEGARYNRQQFSVF